MRIKPKSPTNVESSDASAVADTSAAVESVAAAAPAESWTPEKKDVPTQQQTSTTTTTTQATTTAGTSVAAAVANPPVQVVRPLRELLGCQDKSNRRRIAQRGDYWVLYNYVPARRWFRCDESITYTTHADFTFLDNLEPLLDRLASIWNQELGPKLKNRFQKRNL